MTLALSLFVLFYILMLAVQQGPGRSCCWESWACTISRWRTPPGP